ncbi:MAG: IPT/TIG domain-containing protein [Burkholderiales bacterium]|jgi:hypothetical protein|nr:IPT/TIG domain-containing protein [Burkholderiales bacterium]
MRRYMLILGDIMLCRARLICLNALSLVASAVLLAIVLTLPAVAGTVVEYRHDAAGNIVSIERSGTALAINGFSPESGPVGAEVIIYGSGFSANPSGNAVFFNGVQTSVLYASNASLVVEVPAGATTGPISVNVGANTVTSLSVFTVTDHYAAPEIESFSPSCGAAGTVVTVKGKNFDPAPGATQIAFGSKLLPAQVSSSKELYFVISSNTFSNRIGVITPGGQTQSKGYLLIPPVSSGATCANTRQDVIALAIDQQRGINLKANERVAIMFDALVGDLLSIQFSELVTTNPSNGALGYHLYDGQGAMIKNGYVYSKNSTIPLPPPKTDGSYLLVVTPGVSGSQADFKIKIVRDLTIQANGSSIIVKTDVPGQVIRLGFIADPAQSLGVGISQVIYGKTSSASTTIRALDPEGRNYYSNSYTGVNAACYPNPGEPARCDLSLPIINQTGVHSLLIEPPSDNTLTEGTITLSTNVVGTLETGRAYSLNLTRSGKDGWLSFEGVAGQNITISFTNISMQPANSRLQGVVFRPDGMYLKDYYANQGAASYTFSLANLPLTGTYRLWVSPYLGATASTTINIQ